jgi:hypothetical protein
MDILALILFFAPVGLFVIHAWRVRGRLAARDRWALITSFTVTLTMFVIAPLLINWVIVPTIIWLIAITLFAGGVFGATLHWPELAWFAGTHPIRRAIGVGATLVGCALIIGVTMI